MQWNEVCEVWVCRRDCAVCVSSMLMVDEDMDIGVLYTEVSRTTFQTLRWCLTRPLAVCMCAHLASSGMLRLRILQDRAGVIADHTIKIPRSVHFPLHTSIHTRNRRFRLISAQSS